MKFLCTKVKDTWLSSLQNREKVTSSGLIIIGPFIGIELNNNKPSQNEFDLVNKAVENLFGSHKKAFPVRLIDL